jgi:hypothetical protein
MDLLFNKSKTHPEIIAKVINKIHSDQTKLVMFAFNDIKQHRDESTEYHLIYNDEESELTLRMK